MPNFPSKAYPKNILLKVTPEQHDRLRVYAENNGLKMQVVLRDLIETLPDPTTKPRRVIRRKK